MQRLLSAIALLLCLSPCVLAAEKSAARRAQLPRNYEEVEGVAALVGDQIVLLSDLARAQSSAAAAQAAVPTDAERPRGEAALRLQTLNTLIDNVLIQKAAKDLGLTSEEREVEAQIAQTKKRNSWSDEELAEAVKKIGFSSLAAYRSHVRNELLRMQMLRVKLGSKLRVSDDEIKKVLVQEHGGGVYEEEVHAQHILLTIKADATPMQVAAQREKAWKAYDEVMAAKRTFQEIAEEYGDDTFDLGWQRRWTLDQTFATKLWSLKPGEVSTVVQTPFGFHVIKLLERRRAPVKDKDVLEQYVRAKLSEEQFVRLYKAWIEELRASTHVEVRI